MTVEEENPEFAEYIIHEMRKSGGPWPKTAALDEGFGFRIYGYGRSPARVWIWVFITLAAAGLAGWLGWHYGGPAGERLLEGAYAYRAGQIGIAFILAAGVITFIRTIAVRFLEKLIEPRFEVTLTPESVEIGGWFGNKYFSRTGNTIEFAVEQHSESEDERMDGSGMGGASSRRYAQTQEVVMRHMAQRVVITPICRNRDAVVALWQRLRALDGYIKQSERAKTR